MPYIAVSENDKIRNITENFKGEVLDDQIRFPKELGAKHPFNFEDAENLYKRYGLIAGIVNKITNSVVGDFTIELKNRNAQALIDDFIHNTNFSTNVRTWIREGVLKGNGFMEIDLKNAKIRVLNANSMYVRRTNKGEIIEYNQYTGNLKRFTLKSRILNQFNPDQIAHLPINKIPNDPYGVGIVWSNERVIDNIIQNETDLQKLITRKAGTPIHVKVGQPGEKVNKTAIDQISTDLQYLTNRTEWVTDADVEMIVLNFGEIGKNLTDNLMYNFRMLLAGTEMSEVLMGSGQLNEGIAKVQLIGYDRMIDSIREQVESIIEEKIIRPILRNNSPKLDEAPKFTWTLMGQEEKDNRIMKITELLKNPFTSMAMKAALEIELARLMDIEGLENILPSPQEAQEEEMENKEREREEELEQPETPGAKPNANQGHEHTHELTEAESAQMTIREFINLHEMAGFNYSEYIAYILKLLKIEKFEDLTAITEQDISDGLMTSAEIEKLRFILRHGFRDNQTIRQIESQIRERIPLKDRTKEGKIIIASNVRPNTIARTETVRMANKGVLELYKDNNIKQTRFLAALSERTCPICEGLNGRVYTIEQSAGMIPIHPNCRCTWVPVVEL